MRQKAKQQPLPEKRPDPINTEEPEIDGLRRAVFEMNTERATLKADLKAAHSETSQLKAAMYSELETRARLLTALIADGEALKVYREQALRDTKWRIAAVDAAKGGSKATWSAWKWEPLATDAEGAGAWQFSGSVKAETP